MLRKDLRESPLYREVEALYRALRQPGTGQISDAAEINASPDGRHAVFSGTLMDKLEGAPATRICLTELATGDTRVLTFGPNTDRLPKFSPDGHHIAFLSDRHQTGDFQLYLLDPVSGAARPAARVEGWVEYLQWSPDGRRILLGTAGYGADIANGQGAMRTQQVAESMPSWMPSIETANESYRWRRAWVYELTDDRVRLIGPADLNIWEAAWCGNETIAAVASSAPGEGYWFGARAHLIDLETGQNREIYTPKDQLGGSAAQPSGQRFALIEAVCSDRGIIAGDLKLIETASGHVHSVDTQGVDISYVEWRSERQLLLAGHRGFEVVVALHDTFAETFTELWRSHELMTNGRYISVSGLNESGDCLLGGESFTRAPEIGVIRRSEYRTVKSFDLGYAEHARHIGAVERITWKAPDGLEIQGWLLRPAGSGPFPLVMNVHGGPVFHWQPKWLGRAGVSFLILLKHGHAVFFPNPRGSSGRGQDFARRVVGDMGGADTQDLLSGLDHLVERGIADPERLGVTGGSYGGYMTSWLITQDSRFAAAVSVAPATNRISQRLICNHPHFVDLFVGDKYNNPGGKYFQRSPIMHAHKAKTSTLNICGSLDRCTPPEEAMQFHNALIENGVKSVLVTYPEEGHGVRKFPAAIDYAARVAGWFLEHFP